MLLIIFALSSYAAFGTFCTSSSMRILRPSRHGFPRLSPLQGAQNSQHESPILSAIADVIPVIKERYFFPGHAGGEHAPKSLKKVYGSELFNLDLPELDGLDNIHCPEGPLLRALQLASELFGASQSWFLVNGSTSGILSAVLAAVQIHQRRLLAEKERVGLTVNSNSGTSMNASSDRSIMILGRDSHKASFDGLRLADCDGALLPCVQDNEFGVPLGVDIESISEALETYGSQVCGVLLTRPSYQGVMCSSSTLRDIASLCHSKGVPLIVDEAHGSHLRFLKRPEQLDALACGADIVVQSSHKTLTALSQAAMMHLGREAYRFKFPLQSGGRGGEVNNQAEEGVDNRTEEAGELLQDCFSMLTTTSPNLVLLASLDATRAQMASEGEAMIQSAAAAADEIRYELRQQGLLRDEDSEEEEKVMGGVQLLDDSLSVGAARRHKKCNEEICVDSPQWLIDPLRLTVRFPGRSALDVDDGICEERGIYCELNLQKCITYGIPPGSSSRSLKNLRKALLAEGERDGAGHTPRNGAVQSSIVNTAIAYLHTDTVKKKKSVAIRLLTEFDMIAAVGRISAETICPYPPGIPVLIRGEKLTLDHLSKLTALQDNLEDQAKGRSNAQGSGCTVTGCADQTLQTIRVMAE